MQPNGLESWQVLGGFTARQRNEARGSKKAGEKQLGGKRQRVGDLRIFRKGGGGGNEQVPPPPDPGPG